MGNVRLIGYDRDVWEKGEDLIAICPRAKDNQVFRIFADIVAPLYHAMLGRFFKVRSLHLFAEIRYKL
jgi:hypothetical protein